MVDIKKIFGGIVCSNNTQKIVGGTLTGANTIVLKNISNTTQNEIRNRMIDYNAFRDQYFKNNKIEEQYDTTLESFLYDILPIKCNIFESNTMTIGKIEHLYNLNNEELFILLIDYFKLTEIKTLSYKVIFFAYKELLEKIISIFIKLRNSICCDNNIKKLEKIWNLYNDNNNINTSSIYLYFIFNKIKELPKYKWIIDNKKYKKINNKIHIFLDKLDEINYDYKGFCPYDSKNRMSSIFSFPIKELLDCVTEMDNNNKYTKIYKDIYDLASYTEVNKDYVKNKSNMDYILTKNNINNIKLLKIDRKKEKNIMDTYTNIIKYTFDAYVKFTPYLIKIENSFYKLSNKIENITNKINKIYLKKNM